MADVAEPEFIIDSEGRKVKVILSIEAYEELLEDLHDLSVVAARRDEPSISFEVLEHELKDDGLL